MKLYFQLLRVKDWYPCFFIAVLAFIISKGYTSSFTKILLFYLMILFSLGFSFSINNCFDVKEDKLKKSKKNPVATGDLKFKNSVLFSALFAILGVISSIFFGLKIFLFYIGLLLLSLFYSLPPLRFKSRFLLDIISHGLFGGALLFLFSLIIFGAKMVLFYYIVAFSTFCISVTWELRNHLKDYESDNKAGLKTTVCILSKKKSEKLLELMTILYSASLFTIFLFQRLFLLVFLIATLIFYLTFLTKKEYKLLDVYTHICYGLVMIMVIIS